MAALSGPATLPHMTRSPRASGLRRGALLAAVTLAAAGPAALADTFLLKDGGRVRGELAEEFVGADKRRWLRVTTTFGTVEFRESSLKKRLSSSRVGGVLRAEEVMVSTLKGVVDKSLDGVAWNRISPRPATESDTGAPPTNEPNARIAPGDHVRTGEDGEVDLDVGWGVIHIAPQSELELGAADASATMASLRVERGALGARMKSLPPAEQGEFRVETPQASMGVRGTTFLIRVAETTRVVVESGHVQIDGGAPGGTEVRDGQGFEIDPDGTVRSIPPDAADSAFFERVRDTYAIPRFERALIPGGRFRYPSGEPPYDGSLPGEGSGGEEDGWVKKRVTVPAFQLSRYEVTNAQFRVFVDWAARHDDHSLCHPWEPAGYVHARRIRAGRPTQTWYVGAFAADDQPVHEVEWFDAYTFSVWVGGRLPSDVEFDWALRADPSRSSPDDDWDARVLRYAWLRDNAPDPDHVPASGVPLEPNGPSEHAHAFLSDLRLRTRPVGSLAPDRNGVHDLLGNVSEWVRDVATPGTASVPDDGGPRPDVRVPGNAGNPRYFRGYGVRDELGDLIRRGERQLRGTLVTTGFRPAFDLRE